ncbi:alpha/beta fold hydrolase [Micromonospora sp. U21]|uniref:alpha/beta fold hydrolase n=1 Tax=Micromonospora sp. U21 TaxID=2824899 RepID=UPI001B393481|nr:alpha/beta fold hydrolase [Micromonospora sp. U21]MBQ0905000.1 alpha/beta fold hydrolase [Micromonospora sp. U21]
MKVETERGTFEVHRTGDTGPVVLLLHPLALSGRFWNPIAAVLSERAQVFALDARGHGATAWDGKPLTIHDMAEDAAAVLWRLTGGAPARLGGMSMGGCTAIALAERHPELVDRLLLADTTACYGPDREANWAERARNVESKPRQELIDFQVTRWFSDAFREKNPDEVQRLVDIFLATDSAAHAAASRAMGGFDGTAELGRITAETLVVVGEGDYATPPDMAAVLADRIPRTALEVLPGARHMSLLERPDCWRTLAAHLMDGSLPR